MNPKNLITSLAFVVSLGAIFWLYPPSIEKKATAERNAELVEAIFGSGSPFVEISSYNEILDYSSSAPSLLGRYDLETLEGLSVEMLFPELEDPFRTRGAFFKLMAHSRSDSLLFVTKGEGEDFALIFILNRVTLE